MPIRFSVRALARRLNVSRIINKTFKRHLKLEYTLHRSTQCRYAEDYAPLIILHGLFGSKQNNRSISKYGVSSQGHQGLG